MFSTLPKTNVHFQTFDLSSATAFNLDKSKNLLFGKELNNIEENSQPFQKKYHHCILLNAVFNSISVILLWPVHLSMLSWSSLTSTPHKILSKPLAAFRHNHCRSNGQWWERNEPCSNDYHQSSERILAEPCIKPANSCSQVCNTTDWAMGHYHNYDRHEIYESSKHLYGRGTGSKLCNPTLVRSSSFWKFSQMDLCILSFEPFIQ